MFVKMRPILSVAIVLLCVERASAATPAFTETLASGLSLIVFDDDSYQLGRVGAPWLVSGALGFHSHGTWFTNAGSSPPPPGDVCAPLTDVDCRGNDIDYLNTTSASACCAACNSTANCGAWTLTGETRRGDREGGGPPPWANRCYLKTSCAGKSRYVGHVSGVNPGARPSTAPLVRVGGAAANGDDAALGPWRGWMLSYLGGASRDVPFTCTFKVFPTAGGGLGAIVFEHSFPAGVTGLNTTAVINGTSSDVGGTEFNSATDPASAFPTWLEGSAPEAATLGAASWSGRFAYPASHPAAGARGALGLFAGAEGGPVVMWAPPDGSFAGLSLVLSPFAHFHGTIMGGGVGGSGSGSVGLNSFVTSAPPGFTVSSIAVLSPDGITDAMHAWGGVLANAYGTAKIADASSERLTYWTDNGAYYDWYAYEDGGITSKGVPQDILVELMNTFRNGTYPGPPLPVHAVMLDAYWMYNYRGNGNCKLNDTFWPLPFPRASTLSAELGVPLIIYNGPQCANTTYNELWPLVFSTYWDQGWGKGVLSAVAGSSSRAHYDAVFASLIPFGMTTFTQDFLDFQSLLFPDWLRDPEGKHAWQAGQAAAALALNLPIQYCMALPADFMNAVQFNAVTNARASQDYGAGSGSSWRIEGTSLLLSALGLRASKDNFWSGSAPTDRGREPSPYLSGAVTALSGGPVGFADELLHTDPAVLWPSMMLNGTLLHASRPATAIEAQWVVDSPLAGASVRAAHCAIPPSPGAPPTPLFYTLHAAGVAVGVDIPATLRRKDLWPIPPPSVPYLMWQFNNSACATDGAAAAACVAALGSPSPASLRPGAPSPDETLWVLWAISPVYANGAALLGEVSKYVAVSPQRWLTVAPVAGGGVGLDVVVAGAAGEVVEVAWVTGAAGRVRVKALTVGVGGTVAATLV